MKQSHELIQDLSHEHETIKSILKIISQIVDNSDSKRPCNVKDVEGIIDFIDYFIVRNHYCKEELLFQSLLSIANKSDIESFEGLVNDHKNETNIVKAIIVAFEKCKSISPGSSQVITDNLKTYVDKLQAHILKEDISIYPLINELLTDTLNEEVSVQFQEIQHKVFKTITLEEYKQFILKLEQKYEKKNEIVFF